MPYEDLFANPKAALGYGLLTSRENPLGAAAQLMQQSSAAKTKREQDQQLLDIRLRQADSFGAAPSAVREYEFFKDLTEDEQRAYLGVKRAAQKFDTGDAIVFADPTNPSQTSARHPKGIAPERIIDGGAAITLPAQSGGAPSPAPVGYGAAQQPPMQQMQPAQQPMQQMQPQGGMQVQPIPKTPDQVRAATKSYNLSARNAGNVVQDSGRAMEILKSAGNTAAGWGATISSLPGTDARTLKGHIDSVKGNIGIDKLLEIKASGAGLGQVPQSQLDMLAATLGNLDQAQTVGELYANLARLQNIYADVMRGAREDASAFGIDTSNTDFIEGFTPNELPFDELGRPVGMEIGKANNQVFRDAQAAQGNTLPKSEMEKARAALRRKLEAKNASQEEINAILGE